MQLGCAYCGWVFRAPTEGILEALREHLRAAHKVELPPDTVAALAQPGAIVAVAQTQARRRARALWN